MMKNVFNDKGLTLIELLASIAILSIVIVSFLHFFSQAMLFSGKAEDRMTSINIAEKVLQSVKDDPVKNTETRVINGKNYYEVEPIYINNKSYYPYVNLSKETPESLHLVVVHVLIFADKNDHSAISELFSYIKSEEQNDK
ncbi:type IV pilus modification PilV family protein [Lederbergia citri]|uniref:Type II secretion system protein n=1 Tax=Lederbergia citri TaxID=2833580 RepID=A0A942YGX9_9BACI|nr:type II secretion system protein [Lederbergia citri]MBS4194840.1 type II secretion system protein [Lederbergia citri]